MNKCTNCKDCHYAFAALSDDNDDLAFIENDYEDWYCNHPSLHSQKFILDFVSRQYEPTITPPDWCPHLKKEVKMKKTYHERHQILKNHDGNITWEDIKVGKIYHLPPVGNEERCDLLVISKSDFSMTCKKLDIKNPNLSVIKTFYKTIDYCYKFLSEHKLYDLEKQFNIKEMIAKPCNNTYFPTIHNND